MDSLDTRLADAFLPGFVQVLDSLDAEGSLETKQGTFPFHKHPVDKHLDDQS